jgi:NAD(P) transhydrogenase
MARTAESYDLVVIGAGPAGEKGAAQAAYFGKRVAVIESAELGGATGNTGTLPSKTLRETALYLSGSRSRGLYGIDYSFSRAIAADDLLYRKNLVVASHVGLVRENLGRHRIDLIRGRATLRDAHTVVVETPRSEPISVQAEYILIATGSRPARPPWLPLDGAVFDSDTILHLERLPGSLVIIGAGVIGSEYATTFAALGTRVHLIDGRGSLLPFLDGELSGVLARQMARAGVQFHFNRRTTSVSAGEGIVVELDDGERITGDALLYCGGRCGNTDGLGLEHAGIVVDDRGRVVVDEHYRTRAPSVLAAGDVIGFPALASTSMEQARVAVCHAFGFTYKRQVSSLIPYALYTIPELAMVGASEEALRAERRAYLVGRASFDRNARAQIGGETSGMIKIVFAPEDRRVLGVHIIGDRASDLIHIGQVCMQLEGTIDVFIDSVFNFPTLADAYKYAAYDGLQALERYLAGPADSR